VFDPTGAGAKTAPPRNVGIRQLHRVEGWWSSLRFPAHKHFHFAKIQKPEIQNWTAGLDLAQNWSGTVSLWMRLDPRQDLEQGYSDPLLITQKAWNDAAFFLDFDLQPDRDFRLGVFADYAFWNPDNIRWDQIPAPQRPMVVVPDPPFARDRWTHVLFTFENVNGPEDAEAVCTLYLDGRRQSAWTGVQQFRWDLDDDRTAIMLGIDYIGYLDELMLFDRPLTEEEIQRLQRPLAFDAPAAGESPPTTDR